MILGTEWRVISMRLNFHPRYKTTVGFYYNELLLNIFYQHICTCVASFSADCVSGHALTIEDAEIESGFRFARNKML